MHLFYLEFSWKPEDLNLNFLTLTKIYVYFTWNLTQNLMSLVPIWTNKN